MITPETMLSECARFRLAITEASSLIDRIKATVSTRWHTVMRANGVSVGECALLARSFNHPGFELPAASAAP